MKNLLMRIVLGAILSSSFFACSGNQKGTGTTGDKPVSLEFWTRQTQSDRMAIINLLTETYNTLNPNQEIRAVAVDENDMALQIRTAASAGTLPGVAEIDAEIAIAMGSEGLVDTSAHKEVIDNIGSDNFYSGALKLFENANGEFAGVPFSGMVQAIWYRSDWFKDAGLEPPSNWENLLKAAEYFTDPAANQYGVLVGTMETESYDEQCFTPIAMSNNAFMLDDNGNVVFNSPAMREALEFYAKLARYNPPGPQTWRGRDYYLQGKMAMFFYSTFIMDDLALEDVAEGSLTSENFTDLSGAAFNPELVKATQAQAVLSNKTNSSFGAITGFSILQMEDAAKRDASKQFLNYLFEKDNYITYLHMAVGGMLPTLRAISTDNDFLNDPKGVYQRYGADKIIALNQGFEDLKSFGIVNGKRFELASIVYSKKIIPQMIYKVTQEGMAIDEALAWAQNEIEDLQ